MRAVAAWVAAWVDACVDAWAAGRYCLPSALPESPCSGLALDSPCPRGPGSRLPPEIPRLGSLPQQVMTRSSAKGRASRECAPHLPETRPVLGDGTPVLGRHGRGMSIAMPLMPCRTSMLSLILTKRCVNPHMAEAAKATAARAAAMLGRASEAAEARAAAYM